MTPKIGIVTIHTDFNYGAVLQAVATQKFLEYNNYNAEIINYENKIIGMQSKILYKQDGKISGYIKTFVRNTLFGRFFYYKKAIKKIDRYRKISKEKYRDISEMNESKYDILISGSDQIWNPIISRGIDPVFLLQFGNPRKRISIASSIGSYKLDTKDKEIFKKAFTKFSAISVREDYAKTQISELTEKNIKVIVDPTLLLNEKEWWNLLGCDSKYAEKKEKYILTYFVGENKRKYRPLVAEYAKLFDLPVWTIQYSNYSWKESNKKILGASIADFIALIKNADLVITDSFHGVAFSINLGVNFIAVSNTANPIRAKELLTKLNIEERMDMCPNHYCAVNYDVVNPKLAILRDDSKKWIIDALES